MRREFSIRLTSSISGYSDVPARIRIDGEPIPGKTVLVNARVPNVKGDNIPDKLDSWQKPKALVVDAKGLVRLEVVREWGGLELVAKIHTTNGVEQLLGKGSGTLIGIKHTFKITHSKRTLFEDTPVVVPVTGKWKATEIHSLGGPYKFKTVVAVPGTKDVLFTSYNRETRVYSAMDRIRDGEKTMVWEANKARGQMAETIGGGIVLGDDIWFIPEVSARTLKYRIKTGDVVKVAPLTGDHQFSVEACLWGDRVVFGGANTSGSTTGIYDIQTGKKLLGSPLKGLISALASDGADLWWVVAGKGVCNSRGESWSLKAASIAVWSGSVYAGGQADGSIWKLEAGKWRQVHTVESSKINRMVVARDNCLLIAASNPDTFLRWLPSGQMETLARWTDQPKNASEEQFDAYVNPGHGESILGSRALAAGCKGYRFDREGAAPGPKPDPKPEPDQKWEILAVDYGNSAHLAHNNKWKPVSESDKKAVFLMSRRLYGHLKTITVGSETRAVVPKPFSDGRQVFRMKQPGAAYGKNFKAVVKTVEGKTLTFTIKDGAVVQTTIVPAVS